jgi:hypothetical protein
VSELLAKIQTTIMAIDDIEKAIQERGLNTFGFSLSEYGDLIRRISGGAGSLYPDYATLLLKKETKVETFIGQLVDNNFLTGVPTSTTQWLTTDSNNVYHFNDDVRICETFMAEKKDCNIMEGIILLCSNELVEIIEVTEE